MSTTSSAQHTQDIINALEIQRNQALSALAMARADIAGLKRQIASGATTPSSASEDASKDSTDE